MRILKRSERCGHWVLVYRKSIASFYFIFFPPCVRFNSIVISMKPNRKEASHLYTSKLCSFVPKWKRGARNKKKGLLAGWEPTAAQHRRRFCSKAKKPYTINWRKPKSQRKESALWPVERYRPEFEYPKTRRTKSKEEIKMTKKEKEEEKKWNLLIVAVFFIRNHELLTYIGKGSSSFFVQPW